MFDLSPEALRDHMRTAERSRRHGRFSEDVVGRIFRYGAPVGCRIEQHGTLRRCMDRLKELIALSEGKGESLASGTIVMAEELIGGSGRFDRDWHAPAGGLWMAMAWADTLLPDFTRLLPLAAGVACCEAVRMQGIDAAVKWVNDIHVQGRKIGGILCETVNGPVFSERYHLIGIGVNCNNTVFPNELQSSAVSMRELLDRSIDPDQFVLDLFAALAWNFGLVHFDEECVLADNTTGGLEKKEGPVVVAWRELSDTPGKRVVYGYDVHRHPMYTARVLDIDPAGGLVLAMEDGRVIVEYSGEILYIDAE